jgi:Ca-activated chloride channel family protein
MQFLTPTAFWFALTLPVIIAFYLLKRRRQTRVVSTSLLWTRFLAEHQANAPFQKLRRHWLLLLQLLILSLAILALARPLIQGNGLEREWLIVLIDTSASMQSTDVKPSRMEQAHREVEALIETMDETDQMMLIAAGYPTRVIQSATSSKTDLRRALGKIPAADTGTRLAEGLKLASTFAEGLEAVQIHLFTDGAISDLKDQQWPEADLVYHPIGQRGENVGIVSMDIRPNPEDPTSTAIFAGIANYGSQPRELILELSLDDQLVEGRPRDIAAGATASQTFIANQPEEGVFKLSINLKDDLEIDNEVSLVSRLPKSASVLLVSQGNRFLERAISSIPGLALAVTDTWDPLASEQADLIILDGILPESLPAKHLLAIDVFPQAWFEKVTPEESPTVVDWLATHPIMRFSPLDNVSIASAGGIKAPSWATPIVEASQTPLILAGEEQGRRVVWLGFNPLNSTWPLRVSFPIFVQNAIQWLNAPEQESSWGNLHTGEALVTGADHDSDTVNIRLPDGSVQSLSLNPETTQFVFSDTFSQGIYQIEHRDMIERFASNLLDPSESDTGPRSTIQLGDYGQITASTQERAQVESWRPILLLALSVLLFEWFYYHRRTV